MLGSFPMILIVVILYNLVAFGGGFAGHDINALLSQGTAIPMFSGAKWQISLGDLFLLLGLIMLFIEILFTTCEELSLRGSSAFDVTQLSQVVARPCTSPRSMAMLISAPPA